MASNGKVAVVTGGGSGIGKASALALARNGFSVVVAGRRPDALEETVRLGQLAGAKMLAVPGDLSEHNAVQNLFAQTKSTFGRLDVLFNNAGRGAPGVPMEDLT